MWPKDPFTRSSSLSQVLSEQFSKHIEFEYHDGRVGDIFASSDVSDSVLNMFKGVLSMLQVNIKKSQNVYDMQEVGVCF